MLAAVTAGIKLSTYATMNAYNKRKIKVCYILSYRDPNYIRTQSILNALRESDHFDVDVAINHHRDFLRYFDTIYKLFFIKRQRNPDVFILGFRGHEIYWPVRWIVGNKKIIFDALMSPYSALHDDKKNGRVGVMLSVIWRGFEAGILKNADFILTDTFLHESYYQKQFLIPPEKLNSIPVGAITIVPESSSESLWCRDFSVLFYGSFLPLHGIDIIIDAASKLIDLPVRFDFIGGSSAQAKRLNEQCKKNGVKNYTYQYWTPYNRLIAEVIPNASLCLGGSFGGTPQARRVITGKTSQCLALKKATIIGEIDTEVNFIDGENCLLVEQRNPNALAEKIRWCYKNKDRLTEIGEKGYILYEKELSVSVIKNRLEKIIGNIE
jgi:glycosyltransferase involved in cell wall biosynthesis